MRLFHLGEDGGTTPRENLDFYDNTVVDLADTNVGGAGTAIFYMDSSTETVYAQNNRLILDRFAEKPWNARLTRSAMGNVVRVDREFDDPLPPDARNLDAVVIILIYHDLFWMGADRGRMNHDVFDHLRPGGLYIIIDHSARPGSGSSEVQTLHRIEEPVVRDEVERAGFTLVRTANFLRNPADTRDWNDSPRSAGERRGTSDRFVLAFVKP